jgi:hypothetical protein
MLGVLVENYVAPRDDFVRGPVILDMVGSQPHLSIPDLDVAVRVKLLTLVALPVRFQLHSSSAGGRTGRTG